MIFTKLHFYANALLDIDRALELCPKNGAAALHHVRFLLRKLETLKILLRNNDAYIDQFEAAVEAVRAMGDLLTKDENEFVAFCVAYAQRTRRNVLVNTVNRVVEYGQVFTFGSMEQLIDRNGARLPYLVSKDNLSSLEHNLDDIESPTCLLCDDAHLVNNNAQVHTTKLKAGEICAAKKLKSPLQRGQCLVVERAVLFAAISPEVSKQHCGGCNRHLACVASVPCHGCSTTLYCDEQCRQQDRLHAILCPSMALDIWWDKLDMYSRLMCALFHLDNNDECNAGLGMLTSFLDMSKQQTLQVDKHELIYLTEQALWMMRLMPAQAEDSSLDQFLRHLDGLLVLHRVCMDMVVPIVYKFPYFEETLLRLARDGSLNQLTYGGSIGQTLTNLYASDHVVGFGIFPLEMQIEHSSDKEDTNIAMVYSGLTRSFRARKDLDGGETLVAEEMSSLPSIDELIAQKKTKEDVDMDKSNELMLRQYLNLYNSYAEYRTFVKKGNEWSSVQLPKVEVSKSRFASHPLGELAKLTREAFAATNANDFLEAIQVTTKCMQVLDELINIEVHHEYLVICYTVKLARLAFEYCTEAKLSPQDSRHWAKEAMKYANTASHLLLERTMITNVKAPVQVVGGHGAIDHLIDRNIPVLVELENIVVASAHLYDTIG